MPTHVALLRGINVGGGGKVPMAELRAAADQARPLRREDLYPDRQHHLHPVARRRGRELAAELEDAIKASFGVKTSAVVLTRAELSKVISANPYPDEPNPKWVHGVFLLTEPQKEQHQRVADAVAAAAERGSRDEATIVGKTLYVHTPDGFGTSELAKDLLMKNRRDPLASGTARNWSTITKLLALCEE